MAKTGSMNKRPRVIPALNRLALPLAGRRFLPVWALVRHRGRRSGRPYETPIAVERTPDGFLVSLPYGAGTDWCRNVIAAGGCVVVWKGSEIATHAPTLLQAPAALALWPQPQRFILRLLSIRRFILLRT